MERLTRKTWLALTVDRFRSVYHVNKQRAGRFGGNVALDPWPAPVHVNIGANARGYRR